MDQNHDYNTTNASTEEIGKFFQENDKFIVMAHARPDGDAYGSTLGLGLALQAMGKQVIMMNQDGMERGFSFMPGSDHVQKTPTEMPGDDWKVITVDVARPNLIGKNFEGWAHPVDLNIDHHLENPNAAGLNLVHPEASSAAEITYGLLRDLHMPITPDVASNLYTGISTDTGSFMYSATTPETFKAAAELAEAGADVAGIATSVYASKTKAQLNLQKEVLNAATFEEDDRLVHVHLNKDMYARSGATYRDSDAVLEPLRTLETTEVAFLVDSTQVDGEGNPMTRASIRSRGKVDVQAIARELGGGGHKLAAGIKTSMPAEELEAKIAEGVRSQLHAIDQAKSEAHSQPQTEGALVMPTEHVERGETAAATTSAKV